MCQLFKTTFDDPDGIIENLDPFQKLMMHESWLEDKRERAEEAKNLGYLIGSFTNPEMVKKLLHAEANTFVSDDEEFDKLSKAIIEENRRKDQEKEANAPRRRRRKRVNAH